jgi:amidase
VAELEAKMTAGTLSSEQLTRYYLRRILALDQNGPGVNSVIELNPDAILIAKQMDDLRMHGKILGPLHGMPVIRRNRSRPDPTIRSLYLAG